ncbi:hypothetical protein TNCV_3672361 [Trichonephila clavipes]|nr:hypothetical protein TNCV_3672361 [Trichonephila clavipes]
MLRSGGQFDAKTPMPDKWKWAASDEIKRVQINHKNSSINCAHDSWTINVAKYIEILIRFMKRQRRVRSQDAQQGSWFFVQENARPHTANIAKQFLVKKGVVQIEHPPFSPYLNPPDFFLFPRLKLAEVVCFSIIPKGKYV